VVSLDWLWLIIPGYAIMTVLTGCFYASFCRRGTHENHKDCDSVNAAASVFWAVTLPVVLACCLSVSYTGLLHKIRTLPGKEQKKAIRDAKIAEMEKENGL
jgi:hypothetical protein